ncbi:PTS IIA-like nitrogen regulatory protein PtsN [Allohahella marinimesophila]|uniref:PTS IIA-like nitrogen regulatory protein PtsN n=1 Tax=Allohahella marinimesophila TaxID=1054972 RepID=A0ABP7PYF3_9GAMM
MKLSEILAPALTQHRVSASSKKKVLEYIAHLVAGHYSFLNETALLANLNNRERLGSTGIGKGIAIPHCRLENCDRVIGAFITLGTPVEFDAIDNEPVDLLFVLVVPQEATSEHLDLLGQLAQKFNDEAFCEEVRAADNSTQLFELITREGTQADSQD